MILKFHLSLFHIVANTIPTLHSHRLIRFLYASEAVRLHCPSRFPCKLVSTCFWPRRARKCVCYRTHRYHKKRERGRVLRALSSRSKERGTALRDRKPLCARVYRRGRGMADTSTVTQHSTSNSMRFAIVALAFCAVVLAEPVRYSNHLFWLHSNIFPGVHSDFPV